MVLGPLSLVVAVRAVLVAAKSNSISRAATKAAQDAADEARRSADAAVAANALTLQEVSRSKEVVEGRLLEASDYLTQSSEMRHTAASDRGFVAQLPQTSYRNIPMSVRLDRFVFAVRGSQ